MQEMYPVCNQGILAFEGVLPNGKPHFRCPVCDYHSEGDDKPNKPDSYRDGYNEGFRAGTASAMAAVTGVDLPRENIEVLVNVIGKRAKAHGEA